MHNYLGAIFDFRNAGKVKISMTYHTKTIVEDSGVTGTAVTPAASNLFEDDGTSPLLSDSKREWFHSYVHRVMYLANRIHGECLIACAYLSSRVQKSNELDMAKLMRS